MDTQLNTKISTQSAKPLDKQLDKPMTTKQLSTQLVGLLDTNKLTITTAESCTGGGVSKAITDISGSSSVFEYGFVTYSNEAKTKLVDVSTDTLEKFGAVSAQTVIEMALGAAHNASADIAIAISGIAGPGGGTETKPVGTVWFAIATRTTNNDEEFFVESYQYCFSGDRALVREKAVQSALTLALQAINKKN